MYVYMQVCTHAYVQVCIDGMHVSTYASLRIWVCACVCERVCLWRPVVQSGRDHVTSPVAIIYLMESKVHTLINWRVD